MNLLIVPPEIAARFSQAVSNVVLKRLLEVEGFLSLQLAEECLEKSAHLEDILSRLYSLSYKDRPQDVLEYWADFYKRVYNMTPELKGIKMFNRTPLGRRIYIVATSLNLNFLRDSMSTRYSLSFGASEGHVPSNTRHPKNGSYAIALSQVLEANERVMLESRKGHLSFVVPEVWRAHGCTLLERLLMEDEHFDRTNGHLDIKSLTMCLGSNDCSGWPVGVNWRDNELGIHRYGFECCDHTISRSVLFP